MGRHNQSALFMIPGLPVQKQKNPFRQEYNTSAGLFELNISVDTGKLHKAFRNFKKESSSHSWIRNFIEFSLVAFPSFLYNREEYVNRIGKCKGGYFNAKKN